VIEEKLRKNASLGAVPSTIGLGVVKGLSVRVGNGCSFPLEIMLEKGLITTRPHQQHQSRLFPQLVNDSSHTDIKSCFDFVDISTSRYLNSHHLPSVTFV
jgi:hypothetical protein